jgi:hypothetical protein
MKITIATPSQFQIFGTKIRNTKMKQERRKLNNQSIELKRGQCNNKNAAKTCDEYWLRVT